MVQTRSQAARARAQESGEPIVNQATVPSTTATRKSPRKRTSTAAPNPKAKATAAKKAPASGKGKAKAKSTRKPSKKSPQKAPQPVIATPERPSTRAWPRTPRAPRKSDAPALKSDFPSHLTSSPHVSTFGTPLIMSLDDMVESLSSPTPAPHQRVRFDVDNLVLVPPPSPQVASDASTVVLNEPRRHRSTPRFLSPRDIVASIPGSWVRSPGESSQRLVIVPEDTSAATEREMEAATQDRINQIFQEQYERLLRERDECVMRHQEFLRRNGELRREDAMIL